MAILNEHIVDGSVDTGGLADFSASPDKLSISSFAKDFLNIFPENVHASCVYNPYLMQDNLAIVTSGTLIAIPVYLQKGSTVNKILMCSGTTGSTSLTHSIAAIYGLDNAKKVESADIVTEWAANTGRTFHLSENYTPAASGIHWIVLLVTHTSVAPTLAGVTLKSVNPFSMASAMAGLADSGQTSMPASIGAVAPNVLVPWAMTYYGI